MKYYLTIGGLVRLFNELSGFTVAIISIVISMYCTTAEELKVPYQIVIAIGGILSLIGLINVFFENDEIFTYGDERNDNKNFDNNPNDNTFEKADSIINDSNAIEESN